MINARNMIPSISATWAKNREATNTSDRVKVTYRIQPHLFRGCVGALYGRKSSTIAVQHAYPHHPRPKRRGPNIFATA